MTQPEPEYRISVKEAIGDYFASFADHSSGKAYPAFGDTGIEALDILLNVGTYALTSLQAQHIADILRHLIFSDEGSRYDPVNLLAYWRFQLEEGNTPH